MKLLMYTANKKLFLSKQMLQLVDVVGVLYHSYMNGFTHWWKR